LVPGWILALPSSAMRLGLWASIYQFANWSPQ
jgi:hypothetical protein